ncbi:hypothetical protein CJ030_MR5G013071 [Morella rubra]|uniref:RING-CH-type domain-containing protein n=2 Tax=Morella rubra TaxID=262757 RepID=A0A6A1VM68_9ROSI|nr:hypothetical protein CJ030_MR5G013071 [Morella rubra]
MDQEHHKAQPGPSGPGATENSSSSADELASETGVVANSEERETVCAGQYNRDREVLGCDLGSSKGLMPGHEKIFIQEMIDRGGGSEVPGRVDRGGSENSSNMVDGVVSGTAIVVNSAEALHASGDDRGLGAKVTDLGSSKVSTKDVKKRVSELEKDSVVIDVKCGSGKGFSDNRDGEKVCRICHLSSDQSSDVTTPVPGNANMTETTDLIQLGCCCKDELGIAHSYCAEAWFKLRGNRLIRL